MRLFESKVNRGLHRFGKDFAHFVRIELDRVRFRTARDGGLFNHGGQICWRHAIGRKRCNLKRLAELLYPRYAASRFCLIVPREDARDLVIAMQGFAPRLPLLQGAHIDLHHVRQKACADRSMRRREHAAYNAGNTVHGS
jgi:hypothetical protein